MRKMLVQKEFLTRLSEFDLNTYESRLWVALLSRGVSTAGELSDIANVPRSRSYDVLEALQRKGFINVKSGKPIKYVAIPPVEVLERRKNIIMERAEKHIDLIDELNKNKLLAELTSLHLKGSANLSTENLLGTIKGEFNIQNHLDNMFRAAKKSILIFATAKSLISFYKVIVNGIQKAKSRGVDVKIGTQINKDSEALVNSLTGFANLRHTNKMARLFIIDKRELLFMIYDTEKIHKSYDIGVWINSETLADALGSAFEREFEMLKKAEW